MFKLATNKQIGAYLQRAIKKQGYPSDRRFGKACLEEMGLPTDNEEQRKMSNKLSQILQGHRSVQLEDLPVFTKLLGISCEELLSAGACHAISANRVTNYSVAISTDEQEWEAYVNRDDRLILNADEYGKTVIDYALEVENYGFLKYLTDHKYIWFVGTDEVDLFHGNFGAGTGIERNPMLWRNLNVLDAELKSRYDLRMRMIVLAIRHRDTNMLTALRAREIPTLYQACCFSNTPEGCRKYFDPELIEALAGANDEILAYFSQPFSVTERTGRTNRFLFPFIGELISALLKTKNSYVQWMLKDAAAHNRYVLSRLTELLELSVEAHRQIHGERLWPEDVKADIARGILRDLVFYDDGNLANFRAVFIRDGLTTNLVRVEGSSEDTQTNRLIREVNELYDQIRNIKPNI